MDLLLYVLLFVLGLIFGSFFLVVGTRLPEEKSIVKPGSHCDNCNHMLSWYELIPVISYLFQRGKCRKCGAKIPLITILIEIFTGVLFSLAYYLFGYSTYLFYAGIVLFSIMIIIFISDFKYYIISDGPLIVSIALILVLKFIYFGAYPTLYALISGAFMFSLFLLIKFLGDKAFKKECLGGGDIKLAFLVGAVLGIKLGLIAFVLSAFIAFPYAVIVSLKSKEGLVPYGPFIIGALVLVFTYMDFFVDIINKYFTIYV